MADPVRDVWTLEKVQPVTMQNTNHQQVENEQGTTRRWPLPSKTMSRIWNTLTRVSFLKPESDPYQIWPLEAILTPHDEKCVLVAIKNETLSAGHFICVNAQNQLVHMGATPPMTREPYGQIYRLCAPEPTTTPTKPCTCDKCQTYVNSKSSFVTVQTAEGAPRRMPSQGRARGCQPKGGCFACHT